MNYYLSFSKKDTSILKGKIFFAKNHCITIVSDTHNCHENSHTLTAIDKRLTELQAELLKLANSKADYEKVGDEIYRLRDVKQKAQVENLGRDELQKRITDMNSFLQEQPTALTEYDEALVRRLIEKVTVYENKFTVEFKSGITVDVEN